MPTINIWMIGSKQLTSGTGASPDGMRLEDFVPGTLVRALHDMVDDNEIAPELLRGRPVEFLRTMIRNCEPPVSNKGAALWIEFDLDGSAPTTSKQHELHSNFAKVIRDSFANSGYALPDPTHVNIRWIPSFGYNINDGASGG